MGPPVRQPNGAPCDDRLRGQRPRILTAFGRHDHDAGALPLNRLMIAAWSRISASRQIIDEPAETTGTGSDARACTAANDEQLFFPRAQTGMRSLGPPRDDDWRRDDLVASRGRLHLDRMQSLLVTKVDGVRLSRSAIGNDEFRFASVGQRDRDDRAPERAVRCAHLAGIGIGDAEAQIR